MELTTLEKLEALKLKLKKSIIEGNEKETKNIITQIRDICPHIKLDGLWKESHIIYFNELRCNEDCEKCISY